MYAIIQTGGKQYKVAVGDQIEVELLNAEADDEVEFETLLVADDAGVKVGTPTLSGISVKGKVLGHAKGKKVIAFKYKPKKNSKKIHGHRQPYTMVEILSIG